MTQHDLLFKCSLVVSHSSPEWAKAVSLWVGDSQAASGDLPFQWDVSTVWETGRTGTNVGCSCPHPAGLQDTISSATFSNLGLLCL